MTEDAAAVSQTNNVADVSGADTTTEITPASDKPILGAIKDAFLNSPIRTKVGRDGGIEFVNTAAEKEESSKEKESVVEPSDEEEGPWGKVDGSISDRYNHVRSWATRAAQENSQLVDLLTETREANIRLEERLRLLENNNNNNNEDSVKVDPIVKKYGEDSEEARLAGLFREVLAADGITSDNFVTRDQFDPVLEKSNAAQEVMEFEAELNKRGESIVPVYKAVERLLLKATKPLSIREAYEMATILVEPVKETQNKNTESPVNGNRPKETKKKSAQHRATETGFNVSAETLEEGNKKELPNPKSGREAAERAFAALYGATATRFN